MADVLAIPGVPKPWMAHPKEYAHASRDFISAYSSGFLGSSNNFDKQLSSSPTDWYSVFYPSTSDSPLDFHLLHHPCPALQTQQRPRKPDRAMVNQHRLSGHPMPLMEDRRHYVPLRVEDPRAAYSQSVSPFTTRLGINSALSSNGSTYCESDLESLEHFDEPFTTRIAETHAGLVHPTPRSNMFTVASHSFLLDSEEMPSLSSSGVSDVPRDEQAFSDTPQFKVPNPNPNYAMGTHLNPPSHNPHLAPPISPPHTKPVEFGGDNTWSVCQPANTTDIWYPTRYPTGSSEDSGWHNHNGYIAPWPVSNAFNYPNECNPPMSHVYEPSNGLPMPFFGPLPSVPPGPLGPMSHISHLPASGSYEPSIEVPQYEPTLHPMYVASSQPLSSDTEFGSPDQKHASSLSPSFSTSTNEEERSPQQSGEEQGGIEAGVHYSDERNTFLINCKRRGLSYKDIKRVGGFKEAESTLRGRYRTLTKSKDQRVRKPKWQDKDVSYRTVLPLLLIQPD